MDTKVKFEEAVSASKALSQKPDNETLLRLYSLYKQVMEGDVSTDPPSNPFDFVARAKYNAWEMQKGKSAEVAMQEYIELVAHLKS